MWWWTLVVVGGLLASRGVVEAVSGGGETEDDFYTCIPGFKQYIGVTTPKGDINLIRGSEPIELFCHLNPNHELVRQGKLNSSMLAFQISSSGEYGKILTEPHEVVSEISSNTTIKHLFHPNTYGVYNVQCTYTSLVEKKKEAFQDLDNVDPLASLASGQTRTEVILGGNFATVKKGVCTQRIHVGYPPRDVQNFSCVSENWRNLNCTWDQPYNPIPTFYQLKFKSGRSRYSAPQPCPTKRELEDQLKRKIPKKQNICYVDARSDPQYRQTAMTITFLFNATNPVTPSGHEQIFSISNFGVVRPDPPENLEVTSLPENSLLVQFSIPRELKHFPVGLIYEIRHKASWEKDWTRLNPSEAIKDQEFFNHTLTDLKYYWTVYEIEVRLLSGAANASDQKYWSEPSLAQQRTLPISPFSPPKIHPGSFEVIGGLKDRTVIVFWQKLEEKLYNGDDFRYSVTNVLRNNHSIPLVPVRQTMAYMEFQRMGLEEHTVFITSQNSVGQAQHSSSILVPAARDLQKIQPKSFTRTQYPNNVFEVAWVVPTDKERIVSYTVFWCKNHEHRPHFCEGRLDWEDVPVGGASDRTIVHNVSLPCPTQPCPNYQLAVTANTQHFSSGLVWATCTIIKNRVVGKLKDVSVDSVGETTALVRWRLDCSDRIGIVTGYQIVYCALENEDDIASCHGEELIKDVGPNEEKADLLGLSPWTAYKVMVRIITRGEGDGWMGELSDPVVNRTNPTTPGSAPVLLAVTDVKNDSAQLSWQPPLRPNGLIDLYKIYIEESDKNAWVQTDSDIRVSRKESNTSDTSQTFSNLKAYTEYKVVIVACNKLTVDQEDTGEHLACSDFKAVTAFRTKTGKPNRPRELKVTFKNSSIVELNWDRNFQLGAPRALRWEVNVSRVGDQWNDNPKRTTKNVSGHVLSYTMDLSKIQEDEDWSPDCENVTASSISNQFNFSIRAVVQNKEGQEIHGQWSLPHTVPAFCQTIQPVVLIIGICFLVTITVVFVSACAWKSYKWIQGKKLVFDKMGRELDDQFVVAHAERTDIGKASKEYVDTNFHGKDGGKHRRADSKDSMQGLLNDETRGSQESGRGSDTTSGCESGQSSELGDREGGPREGEDLEDEEVGVDPSELPLVSASNGPSSSQVWLGPMAPSGHYTRCVPEPSSQIGYSKVGSLHPPNYVNQTPPVAISSSVNTSEPVSSGYVTFNSVKSSEPECFPVSSTPGYITVDQLASSSSNSSQDKEPSSCLEIKEPPLSPPSLPQGYSRVGMGPITPGYVAWTSPASSHDPGNKPSSLSLVTRTEPETDSLLINDKEGDSLLISPRSLVLSGPGTNRLSDGGTVSGII